MKENTRAVILRLPETLIERIDGVVHDLHCRSRSAFLRSSIQSQVAHHEGQLRERAKVISIPTRTENERQHNAHIRGRLQNALNLAPETWSFERLQEVED